MKKKGILIHTHTKHEYDNIHINYCTVSRNIPKNIQVKRTSSLIKNNERPTGLKTDSQG